MQTLDWHVFQLINGLAGHSGALDALMKGAAAGLEYVLLALIATLWLTPGESEAVDFARRRLVVLALLAALLALGVNQVIGAAWDRPRPFVQHHVTQLVSHAADASFPSDHVAGGAGLAVTLLLALDRWARRLGWIMLALVVVLAFARVYIGVHYPGDVLGGGIVGAGAAYIVQHAGRLLDVVLLPLLRPLDALTRRILDFVGFRRWGVVPSQPA